MKTIKTLLTCITAHRIHFWNEVRRHSTVYRRRQDEHEAVKKRKREKTNKIVYPIKRRQNLNIQEYKHM
jgi:hypothetical protein